MPNDTTALSIKIMEVFHAEEVGPSGAIVACIEALAGIVWSTACPDCREMWANRINEAVPLFVEKALKAANEKDQLNCNHHLH